MTVRSNKDRARGRALRPLGADSATDTPASIQQWFVTAHSTRPQRVDGRQLEWPASLVHAKQMGSTTTACGVPASS